MVVLFVATISTYCIGQINPFSKLKIDSVVIYDYNVNAEGEHFYPIIYKGKLSWPISKSIKLDKQTADTFTKKLELKESYGNSRADCFEPHLGIVYYLKGKPLEYVSICLYCNMLRASKEIPEQLQGKQGTRKEVYYTLDGMSKSFRKYLNDLIKKYNFSNQIKKNSLFDN